MASVLAPTTGLGGRGTVSHKGADVSSHRSKRMSLLALLAPAWNFEPEDYESPRGDRKGGPPEDVGTDICSTATGDDDRDIGLPKSRGSARSLTEESDASSARTRTLAHPRDGDATERSALATPAAMSIEEEAGPVLESCPPADRGDRATVLAAVSKRGADLQFASDELRADPQVVATAVGQDSWAMEFALGEARWDRDIAMTAVRGHGGALEFVDECFQRDQGVVLEAVCQKGWALKWASEDLRTDREVLLAAIRQDYHAMEWVGEELRSDAEIVAAALWCFGERCRECNSEPLWAEDWLTTDFTVAKARELAWRWVTAVESRYFKRALDAIFPAKEEEWMSEEDIAGRLGLLHLACFPSSAEPGAAPAWFAEVQEALWVEQSVWSDIEVMGLLNRFEASLGLPDNHVLLLDEAVRHGSKFPECETPIPLYLKRKGKWEKVDCDSAYPQDGEALVVPPNSPDGPAPIILYLVGAGKFNSRETFLSGELTVLWENVAVRENFYMVIPKPDIRTGLIYYLGQGYKKEWSEDAVWCLFTEIIRRLGPEKVDPSRLYVSGASQGAVAAWGLAVKYGSMIAASQPMGGRCEWPGNSWPKNSSSPTEEAMENLKSCPLRCSHCSTDSYAPPPKHDMESITYYATEERTYDIAPFGWDCVTKMDTTVRKWVWSDTKNPFELVWVTGPMADNCTMWAGLDNHLVWFRCITNPMWGWTDFFLEHSVPEHRRWRFESEPMKVDTSAHRKFLEQKGYWDKPDPTPPEIRTETVYLGQVSRLDECGALSDDVRECLASNLTRCAQDHEMLVLLQIDVPGRSTSTIELALVKWHADVSKAVTAFQKHLGAAVQGFAQGQELSVSLQVSIPVPPEAVQFHVVANRPWDKAALCKLRPGLPVLALKIRAAELIYMDAKKANTFEVGLRQNPKPGEKPQPVAPLPIDMPLTEDHLELDACLEDKKASAPPLTLQATDASMMKLMVLLAHHEDHEVEGYRPTIHAVKKGAKVIELKRTIADITGRKLDDFGICPATAFPESDREAEGVIKYPLKDSAVLTDENWLLQVCDLGLAISLDLGGVFKDMNIDKGTSVRKLKWILANGNEKKARIYSLALVPAAGGKTEPLPDDLELTEAHARLVLC